MAVKGHELPEREPEDYIILSQSSAWEDHDEGMKVHTVEAVSSTEAILRVAEYSRQVGIFQSMRYALLIAAGKGESLFELDNGEDVPVEAVNAEIDEIMSHMPDEIKDMFDSSDMPFGEKITIYLSAMSNAVKGSGNEIMSEGNEDSPAWLMANGYELEMVVCCKATEISTMDKDSTILKLYNAIEEEDKE